MGVLFISIILNYRFKFNRYYLLSPLNTIAPLNKYNELKSQTLENTMKTSFIKKLITTNAGFAALALRIPAAIIFIAHGAQKLFGSFGGYGLEGTGKWMASIGLEPGYQLALLAGSAEFFGGIALLIGLLVRPAALMLTITMLVAIFSVHFANGLFMTNNGYEFALALLAVSVSLMFSGAGKVALDNALKQRLG
jgi:putative oxidoreductase